VTGFATLVAGGARLQLMFKTLRIVLMSTPLVALPTLAATGASTGITGVRTGLFLFTIAGALFLTLVFRTIAAHLGRFLLGLVGRWRVRRTLHRLSPSVLDDFILPGAYGGLAHIDHAMLTAGGILCILTKHYNGIVFGDEDEAQWTNVDGISRRRFLNPLIQNEGRRRALQRVVSDVPVANLVIFTGAVEFTSVPPKNVIRLAELDSFLAKFIVGPARVEDWDAAWLTVKSAAMTDSDTRKDLAAQISFT